MSAVTDGPLPDAPARTRVLDAAERIVRERGVPALTLEGAAREAGVSKGGLLYHFASKEALLAALLQRLADHVTADYEALLAAQPPGPGRACRAVLAWTFDRPAPGCEEHERAAAVFLAAFHHDPALLDPVRRFFARLRADCLSDGSGAGPAMAVMTAGDGLFMARVFRLYEPGEAEVSALRESLSGLLP